MTAGTLMPEMNAADLLALTRPEDLYPGDPAAAKRRYHELSLMWHPDRPTGRADVFARVSELYRQAVERLENGRWEGATVLSLQTSAGGHALLAVRSTAPFVLGQQLIADDTVSYLVDPVYERFVTRATAVSAQFRFASPRMEDEFKKYLPVTLAYSKLHDGRTWLQYRKTPDQIRLRDLVTHLGTLDPKHCAWVVSSLLNLSCYFAFTGLVHHDISPDTVFVSPPHHSAVVLGGWWYVTERGKPVSVVPQRTFDAMPHRARMKKVASTRTDVELIRLTALEIMKAPIPEPMGSWLRTPGSGSVPEQYAEWRGVLERTFGPRRFHAMATTADDVYGGPVSKVN